MCLFQNAIGEIAGFKWLTKTDSIHTVNEAVMNECVKRNYQTDNINELELSSNNCSISPTNGPKHHLLPIEILKSNISSQHYKKISFKRCALKKEQDIKDFLFAW